MLPRSVKIPPSRALLLALLTIALSACGGGGGGVLPDRQPQPAVDTQTDSTNAPLDEPHNTLTTTLPGLSDLSPGTEFSFSLSGDFQDELFQGSARILYNSSLVQPVAAERGDSLPEGCVFVSSLDGPQQSFACEGAGARAGYDRYIPLAFTGRPGSAPLSVGQHRLAQVRFTVLRAPGREIPVRLQNDADFLQLRDRYGQRLRFNLQSNTQAAP